MTKAVLVSVSFDAKAAEEKIRGRLRPAQRVLDSLVLKDSNCFCPEDTSTLQKSAVTHTVIGSGSVVWRTPYAAAQYYGEDFDHSQGRNPNATAKWFETAKARRGREWEEAVNDAYHKGDK